MPVASSALIWFSRRTDLPLETEGGGGDKTNFVKVSILLPSSGRNTPRDPLSYSKP